MKHHLLKFLTLLLALAATTTGLAYAQQQQPPPPDTVVYEVPELDSIARTVIKGNELSWELKKRFNIRVKPFEVLVFRDSALIQLLRENANYSPRIDSLLINNYFMMTYASGGDESFFYKFKLIPSQGKTIFYVKRIAWRDHNGTEYWVATSEELLTFIPKSYFLTHFTTQTQKVYGSR